MPEYSLEDLIFVCNVLQSSVRYSNYEKGALQRIVLVLEKLQELFENVKEPDD